MGVLRDPERTVLRRANEPAILLGKVKDRLLSDPALTVAKSNVRSRVHRRGYMDYVGIKRTTAKTSDPWERSVSWACSPPRPMTSRRRPCR